MKLKMRGKHLFEYAVIRVLPKVEREEFINAGIILFSKRAKYIRMMYKLDTERLNSFSTELDLDLLEETLKSFEKICIGSKEGRSDEHTSELHSRQCLVCRL